MKILAVCLSDRATDSFAYFVETLHMEVRLNQGNHRLRIFLDCCFSILIDLLGTPRHIS